MNTAADMYPAPQTRCAEEAAALYVCECVHVRMCVHVSAGGQRKKYHFLIKGGPSWPSALLWELVQCCTGTIGFVGLLAKKTPQGRQPDANTHTHTHLSVSHTQACMTHTAVPRHVLSDGKSGLPFRPVH